jgi:hypothetical protein
MHLFISSIKKQIKVKQNRKKDKKKTIPKKNGERNNKFCMKLSFLTWAIMQISK